jgi:hypothetical protein
LPASAAHDRKVTTTPTTVPADLDGFVERYLSMWNEPDAARRRALVEVLWAPSAVNTTATLEAVGHDEITARVTRAFDTYVGTGEHRFEEHRPYAAHHDAVRVWWQMVRTDGTVAAVGQEFLVLDGDGRIRSDHQFPVS